MSEGGRPQPHGEYLTKPSYSFLQTIGEGNTGVSRLWHHDLLGLQVVSKTDSYLGRGGIAKSEPRILLKVKHPHIVELFEAQYEPGNDPSLQTITFTTRYCEGRSVHTALEEGHPFSINEARAVLADVLDALAYMHEEHRYLHRDVKPGNIMLDTERRRGFLGDLGSADEMDTDGKAPPHGGTPLYRPPEAASGFVTAQSDLYGAGMVALEMVNGPLPYELLDYDQIEARIRRGKRAVVDRLFAPAPWVPSPFARLLRSMTSRDDQDRPRTAAAALRAVRDAACVDWRRLESAGLGGVWRGSWPPEVAIGNRRQFEVTTAPLKSGPNRGRLRLRVSTRTPQSSWRYIARLDCTIGQDDSAGLTAFFRRVESHAAAAR